MSAEVWKEILENEMSLCPKEKKIKGTSEKGKTATQNYLLLCNVVISIPPAYHLRLQQTVFEKVGLVHSDAEQYSLP